MGIKIDTIFYDYWNNICTSPNNINLDDSFDDVIDNCIKYDKNIIWKQFPEPNTKISKDDIEEPPEPPKEEPVKSGVVKPLPPPPPAVTSAVSPSILIT